MSALFEEDLVNSLTVLRHTRCHLTCLIFICSSLTLTHSHSWLLHLFSIRLKEVPIAAIVIKTEMCLHYSLRLKVSVLDLVCDPEKKHICITDMLLEAA
jgi:hypothetical protein